MNTPKKSRHSECCSITFVRCVLHIFNIIFFVSVPNDNKFDFFSQDRDGQTVQNKNDPITNVHYVRYGRLSIH